MFLHCRVCFFDNLLFIARFRPLSFKAIVDLVELISTLFINFQFIVFLSLLNFTTLFLTALAIVEHFI